VVGASRDRSKAGYQMLRTLGDFPGPLYPVNPKGGEILGRPALSSVRKAPEEIDLAVLVVPPAVVPDALEDCAAAGVEAAIICAGGFAEAGARGEELQTEVLHLAADSGMRLLGPNTSGLVNPGAGLFASFVPSVRRLQPGGLAIVAQSGGVNHALAFLAAEAGLGVHFAVGLGNAADVGPADVLEHLADDDTVEVVALHIEGVEDGRRLVETVAALTSLVPVVAVVAGRSDVERFASSHTGALTRDWALTTASLEQAGAVVVETSRELVSAAHALATRRLPPVSEPGVGIVTGQAGPGILITDTLRTAGLTVPELQPSTREQLDELLPDITYHDNPVDTGRPGPEFGTVLETVSSDPRIDVVVAYGLHEPDALDPKQVLAAANSGVPLVFGTGGPTEDLAETVGELRTGGVPVLTSPEETAYAARALVADARSRYRRATARPELTVGLPEFDRSPDEAEAKLLLSRLSIAVPEGRACRDRAEAHEALAALGPPLAIKGLDPSVSHKTERGLVHLGVRDAGELDRALDAIETAGIHRFLVERMVEDGVELILGGSRHPAFGPTVLVGLGGVFSEALRDVAVRLAPLTMADAHEMLGDLRAQSLLEGFRGLPTVDRDAVADVIVTIGALVAAEPRIVELDINPLRVTTEGPVALDVFWEASARVVSD
jgi:acetate---CoA ligase (ADP-forming)